MSASTGGARLETPAAGYDSARDRGGDDTCHQGICVVGVLAILDTDIAALEKASSGTHGEVAEGDMIRYCTSRLGDLSSQKAGPNHTRSEIPRLLRRTMHPLSRSL